MDLFGIPIRITVGKKLEEGFVEMKLRSEEMSNDIKIENVLKTIEKMLETK